MTYGLRAGFARLRGVESHRAPAFSPVAPDAATHYLSRLLRGAFQVVP